MGIMLGNLNVNEVEKRAGVTFPEELKLLMEGNKQHEADNVAKGKWHCFDIPFTLVCGDIETATTIYNRLKHLSSSFKENLEIAIQQ